MEESKALQLKEKHKKLRMKFKGFVQVDKARLNNEMIQIASITYAVGEIKATSEYEMNMAEKNLEVTEAKIDKSIRDKFSGKRKPSEQQIKSMVLRNPKVLAAREAFIEAKWKHNICWAATNAVSQKGNQLTNLAYNYRKELDRGLGGKVKESKVREKGKEYMNKEREAQNG